MKKNLENLSFNNIITKLPLDKIEYDNNSRIVRGAIYSRVKPTPVKNPTLVSVSTKALKLIDLNENQIAKKEFAEYFSGNKIMTGSDPLSHCYCGHQFGQFAGQLGDGRAITLGVVLNNQSERWELQLKGAGKTPYSRQADGRAVLRSSIREFLCSEAFDSLGIPTTRAGTIITSETKVTRDPLYDGRTKEEPCTIVLRMAPSFIRFGSFEITKSTGPSPGMHHLLNNLLDYLLKYYYTDIDKQFSDKESKYRGLFREVVRRTAIMVAEWQCVGFCHGVLNTDNMSILGLTMDFGPFGFMERFDPKFVCNHSDTNGLYSYENQPNVCYWNLTKLAEALEPVLSQLKAECEAFWPIFYSHCSNIMHRKLGLVVSDRVDDTELFQDLFKTMHRTGADFTNTFRTLSLVNPLTNEHDSLYALLNHCDNATNTANNEVTINNSLNALLNRGKPEPAPTISSVNNKEKNCVIWNKWLDKYRQRLQYDMSIINSKPDSKINEWLELRINTMNTTNPKYVLRNWMAQKSIDAAELHDYTEVNKQLKLLQDPYGLHDNDPDNLKYILPSQSTSKLQVSCSS